METFRIRFVSLNIRDRIIDKTTMRNALSLFRRYQIVELLDQDMGDEESRVLIYDSILMAGTVQKTLKQHMRNWRHTEREETKAMKKLTRMKLINWHRFNNCTIEFGDSTLLSGENGAGKSTLLDAIQFVIICSTGYFNKAAHENGKRRLIGYIRCKTGKENQPYERTGEISAHVALEFYEESKDKYFIIGAVVDSASESQETTVRYLMENTRISDDLFCTETR